MMILKTEIAATDRGDERVKASLKLIRAALGVSQGDTETRTLVDRNRSRRLRALMGLPPIAGVGRGATDV
eukprot:scaffold3263_cov129-Isochrysis_galbana.AAC.1